MSIYHSAYSLSALRAGVALLDSTMEEKISDMSVFVASVSWCRLG